MEKYNCMRCGFSTDHKNNYRKHIYRKHTCKSILKEVPIILIREKFESEDLDLRNHSVTSESLRTGLKNVYLCKYCKREFNNRQNRWRHEKSFCKDKCVMDEMNIKMDTMMLKIETLETQNKNLIQNNTFENTKINSDNTIIVNNFGEENLDYISDHVFRKMIQKGPQSIPSLIKHIHFNPNHPENHNVRMKNKKLKYLEVKKGNKWEYKHKKVVLDDLVDFGYVNLEEFKQNNGEKMDALLIKGFTRMMKSYLTNKEKLINQVELEVINGMNQIEI